MDHDDISSLASHIEGHLSFLREALAADNAVRVAEQAEEIEGWARSIAEAAAGDGSGLRPEARLPEDVEMPIPKGRGVKIRPSPGGELVIDHPGDGSIVVRVRRRP
jgi:hypothetical protein